MKSRGIAVALLAMMLLVFASGCKKKPPVAPPPPPAPKAKVEEPPPPAAKPSVRFVAEPSRIEPGQAVTLRWSTTNAEKVTISGVGDVAQQGSSVVTPRSTTTYVLTATGPGGDTSASATVNVASPPPPPPAKTSTMRSLSEMLSTMLSDALFDYNKSDIREDARAVLAKNSDALKSIFGQMSDAIVVVEGHCDERGSAEYNLGLADRRASKAKEYLVQMGVTSEKLRTVSYGKERPVCTESNEDCWQRNRRAHFAPGQ